MRGGGQGYMVHHALTQLLGSWSTAHENPGAVPLRGKQPILGDFGARIPEFAARCPLGISNSGCTCLDQKQARFETPNGSDQLHWGSHPVKSPLATPRAIPGGAMIDNLGFRDPAGTSVICPFFSWLWIPDWGGMRGVGLSASRSAPS